MTARRRGVVKGQPHRFVHGHSTRVGPGARNWSWNGGRKRGKGGYQLVAVPDHPSSDRYGYVPEHRVVVERRIGRLLDAGERVHHVNEDKDDNRPENLWLFPDDASHALWHMMGRYGCGLTRPMAAVPIR